jgi:predicted kinase
MMNDQPSADLPTLYIVCGLPGTGKSTVAKLMADRVNATILRTDEIRRRLYPVRTYSPDESQHVYAEMFSHAAARLKEGGNVLLDATFVAATHRATPIALAADLGVSYQLVHVTSSEALIRERLAARTNDPSEADFAIYLRLKRQFEPITEAHMLIDNRGTLADLTAAVTLQLQT